MSIGSRLKGRRKELRLSVAEVADAVGMAHSTLYDIERGDQESSTKLHLLCAFLGLNPKWVETERGPRLAERPDVGTTHKVAEAAARYTLHGMQITPEETELGIEWGKLEEPLRSAIKQQIYLLVAEQVRRKRRKDPPGEQRPSTARKPS